MVATCSITCYTVAKKIILQSKAVRKVLETVASLFKRHPNAKIINVIFIQIMR